MSVRLWHTTNLGHGNHLTVSKRIGGKKGAGDLAVGLVLAAIVFLPIALLVLLYRGLKQRYSEKVAIPVVAGLLLVAFIFGGVSAKKANDRSIAEQEATAEAVEVIEKSPEQSAQLEPEAEAVPVTRAMPTEKSEPEEKQAPEQMVWIAASGNGTKYHRSTCSALKNGKKMIPLSEAEKMGLTPCKLCGG